MKMTKTLVMLFQVIALSIAGTGKIKAEAEWTVMIYLNADNNLEEFGIKDFFEMAKVGSTDKVNVVVQFDRIPQFDDSEEDWTNTLRFLVKKDMTPTPANAVEDLGEVNMADPGALSDFIRWARKQYPAKRDMLVIWDHGQGWRLPSAVTRKPWKPPTDTDQRPSRPSPNLDSSPGATRAFTRQLIEMAAKGVDLTMIPEPEVLVPQWAVEGPVKYVSSDTTSSDHLYNREVQNALESMDRLIDVIGFDACLMQMIETGFAIRRSGRVMVGSEELEPGDGWNYQFLLGRLTAKPTMNAEELGRTTVDSYKEQYGSAGGRTTLSALKLADLNAISSATSRLGDACSQRIGTENKNIRAARDECKNYAPGFGLHGIDLQRFCEQLKSRTQDQVLRGEAQAVISLIDSIMLANYASPASQGKYGSRGLSIYFPRSYDDYVNDPDGPAYDDSNTVFPVEFVMAHRWDNFLHSYFALNPR